MEIQNDDIDHAKGRRGKSWGNTLSSYHLPSCHHRSSDRPFTLPLPLRPSCTVGPADASHRGGAQELRASGIAGIHSAPCRLMKDRLRMGSHSHDVWSFHEHCGEREEIDSRSIYRSRCSTGTRDRTRTREPRDHAKETGGSDDVRTPGYVMAHLRT